MTHRAFVRGARGWKFQARHCATLGEDARARFGRPRVDGDAQSTDKCAVWEETSRCGSTTVRARVRCDAERELGERAMGGGITRGIAIVQLRWMMMVCLRRLYLMCVCVVGVLIVGLSLRRVV